jgi:tetratricopeptide (TPR) repeat protein
MAEKADAFTHMGNYSEALKLTNEILSRNATNVDGLESKGATLLQMGNDTGALTTFDKIHPVMDWVLDNRAKALTSLGNFTGAISDSNMALKINPSDSYAYNNKASALLHMDLQGQQHNSVLTLKDLDKILQDLNKALRINFHDPYAQHLKTMLMNGLELEYIVR